MKYQQVIPFFLLLVLFQPIESCAQEKQKEELQRKEWDAEVACDQWNYYLRAHVDSLKIIGVNLLLGEDTISPFRRAVANRFIGSYNIRSGNIEEGIRNLKRSEIIFRQMGDKVLLSQTLTEIGNGKHLNGEYQLAIKYFYESSRIGQLSTGSTAGYASWLGLSKAFWALNDTVNSRLFGEGYVRNALIDEKYEAASDGTAFVASTYDSGDQLFTELLNESIEYANKSTSKIHVSHALTNRGILFLESEQLDSAEHYFLESLQIRKEIGSTKNQIESYFNLGGLYYYSDQFLKSEEMLLKAHKLAAVGGDLSDEKDIIELLKEVYDYTEQRDKLNRVTAELEILTQEIKEKNMLDVELDRLVFDLLAEKTVPLKTKNDVNWAKYCVITLLLITSVLFIRFR